jgi:hypothetical protein
MPPYFQPVLDALRAHPGDVWLEMLRDLCEAVEAEDRGKIVLLTGPFVRTANPRMRPIEDLPESLFYETMARLLFLGQDQDCLLLVEWYERVLSFAGSRQQQITENWIGVFGFVALPQPKLSEAELDRELKRLTRALNTVLAAFADAVAAEGPPVPYTPGIPGELPPGSFGTATFNRPSRSSALGAGIVKLVSAWMAVHQQFLDAALEDLGSKKKDRGAKLLALRTRWLQALGATFADPKNRSSARLAQVPIELATIKYGRSPHHTYLDASLPHEAREFGFTPYDREPQDEPPPKSVWLVDLLRYRGTQLHFLLDQYGEFYPLDFPGSNTPDGRRIQAARKKEYDARRELIDKAEKTARSLYLESENEIASFACAFHQALVSAYSAQSPANARLEAWGVLLNFLDGYLATQTVHTEFNLDDEPSYFDRQFPRAVSGGELLDCGVYAVRFAWVFLSLADCLKQAEARPPRVSFIMLPLHVGLIVEIDGMPPLIMHNQALIRLTADQSANWRKEWDAAPDTSGPDPKDPARRDEKFLEDVAAQVFLRDVDMPLRRVPVAPVSAPPKKHQVWRAFRRLVVPNIDRLFSRLVENAGRKEFQFDLRFLGALTMEKRWHDAIVVPFWNVGCHGVWNRTDARGNPLFTTESLKRDSAKRKQYADALEALITPVEASYDAEIRPMKNELTKEFRANPQLFGRAAQRVTTARRLQGAAAGIGPVGQVREHIAAIRNGTVTMPPFATEAGFLSRHGD